MDEQHFTQFTQLFAHFVKNLCSIHVCPIFEDQQKSSVFRTYSILISEETNVYPFRHGRQLATSWSNNRSNCACVQNSYYEGDPRELLIYNFYKAFCRTTHSTILSYFRKSLTILLTSSSSVFVSTMLKRSNILLSRVCFFCMYCRFK